MAKDVNAQMKKKNRLVSYACIGVFTCAIIGSSLILTNLFKTIYESNQLQHIKEDLIEEKNKLVDGEEQDCYTVYVKDDYTLVDGEVYIFKK